MSVESCLPASLCGPETTIIPVGGGLSGAGVYRVEAAGDAFVLKVSAEGEPVDAWRRRLHVQRLAADAGLAPRIVHVDEERRAILSEFVADLGFPPLFGNPQTREAALAQLGRTIRRVHDLPLPADAERKDAREMLRGTASALDAEFAVPDFVRDAVQRVLGQEPPASDRPLVLSHNDVHPANIVYDGENLLLVDWDVAGLNDPLYDLAAISLFLRMDEATCAKLLAAHDGHPVSELPPRFAYNRRLVGVLCGTMFLNIARQKGHPGDGGAQTIDSAPALGELYQRMRAGALNLATTEGQWSFGLALIKEGVASRDS